MLRRCQDGAVLLHGNRCRQARTCPAGHVLLGHARVDHPAMDHGVSNQSACPHGFEGRLKRTFQRFFLSFFEDNSG